MIVKMIFLIIILLFINVNANDQRFYGHFVASVPDNSSQIKAIENENTVVFVSLTFSVNNKLLENEKTVLQCWMDYEKVGILVNWTNQDLPHTTLLNSTVEFNVTMHPKRLGGSFLICSVGMKNNSTKLYQQAVVQLVVRRTPTVVELIFRIVVSIFVIILTFVMGCGLDRDIILGYLKRPISPSIGFCSQFIFMPLASAALGKLTGIDNAFGLGLLTIGCSPGGGASNVWTVLFSGDLNLSVTMTFVSSCAALIMMPLWMFLLGRFFIDPKIVRIPYGSIGLNLLQVVVPVGFGILFRWKWNDKALILIRKVKLMGLAFVIFILTFGSYANAYIYRLLGDYIYLLPIGAMLPWTGFIFGFILAVITKRNRAQAIAISIETGFQNIGIAILILKFSMPQPSGDLGSTMPIVVAIFTPIPLYIALMVMYIRKRCCKKEKETKEIRMEELKDQQKAELLEDDGVV